MPLDELNTSALWIAFGPAGTEDRLVSELRSKAFGTELVALDQLVASTATHVPLKAAVPQRASIVRLSVTSLMLSPACC